ncbi:hypothetical protein [Enterobacter sp. Bisph1]|nr:hypothetical protein [Enterobacter sp. Bisph1]
MDEVGETPKKRYQEIEETNGMKGQIICIKAAEANRVTFFS